MDSTVVGGMDGDGSSPPGILQVHTRNPQENVVVIIESHEMSFFFPVIQPDSYRQ